MITKYFGNNDDKERMLEFETFIGKLKDSNTKLLAYKELTFKNSTDKVKAEEIYNKIYKWSKIRNHFAHSFIDIPVNVKYEDIKIIRFMAMGSTYNDKMQPEMVGEYDLSKHKETLDELHAILLLLQSTFKA